jgi:Domain of unknown function (DUF4232)
VAALLAGIAAATAGGARGAARGCAGSGLVVWLDTTGDGTAGSIYYKLELTNLSGHTCTLRGYPGVSGIDLHGRQLGSPALRNPAHPTRAVSLRNGASATAVLRIVEAGNYPRATCRPVSAAGIRVYPPNDTASKLVPFPFQACSRKGPSYLQIETVTA